jgi:hypothetical protein
VSADLEHLRWFDLPSASVSVSVSPPQEVVHGALPVRLQRVGDEAGRRRAPDAGRVVEVDPEAKPARLPAPASPPRHAASRRRSRDASTLVDHEGTAIAGPGSAPLMSGPPGWDPSYLVQQS